MEETACWCGEPLPRFMNGRLKRSCTPEHLYRPVGPAAPDNCKNCGKPIDRSVKRPGRKTHYCSDACRAVVYKGPAEIDYEKLLKEQNGVCAICKRPEHHKGKFGHIKKLARDHCHNTNTSRKLLCQDCNTGLGAFQDSPEILRAAADYLESF